MLGTSMAPHDTALPWGGCSPEVVESSLTTAQSHSAPWGGRAHCVLSAGQGGSWQSVAGPGEEWTRCVGWEGGPIGALWGEPHVRTWGTGCWEGDEKCAELLCEAWSSLSKSWRCENGSLRTTVTWWTCAEMYWIQLDWHLLCVLHPGSWRPARAIGEPGARLLFFRQDSRAAALEDELCRSSALLPAMMWSGSRGRTSSILSSSEGLGRRLGSEAVRSLLLRFGRIPAYTPSRSSARLCSTILLSENELQLSL